MKYSFDHLDILLQVQVGIGENFFKATQPFQNFRQRRQRWSTTRLFAGFGWSRQGPTLRQFKMVCSNLFV